MHDYKYLTIKYNISVTTCEEMFKDNYKMKEIDLTNFDSSLVTNMKYMFYGTNLKSLDLSNFRTSSVIDMSYMFSNIENMDSLNLSGFNTASVKRMNSMFYNSNFKSLILSNFDTSSVIYMNRMFLDCQELYSLDITNFNTTSVINMGMMFSGSIKLTSLNLSNFKTSNVENMGGMFSYCDSLEFLNLSNFDTSSVKYMTYSGGGFSEGMFIKCSSLTSLIIDNFNTSSVNSMLHMFNDCSSLKFLNLSSFNTSQVGSMSYMFSGCKNLQSLDLSNFDSSSLYDIEYMFQECYSLTTLKLPNFNNLDLYMKGMFKDCRSLISLDLSNFNNTFAISMHNMFYGCGSLTSLDLSNFDTNSVTDMNNMFSGCASLTSLDLSNFDTNSVTDMSYMFSGCSSLKSINLSSFSTDLVENMDSMFSQCSSLKSLNLSSFDTSSLNSMINMFKGDQNLEYLNFYHLSENSNLDYGSLIFGLSDNLVLCFKEIPSFILSQLEDLKCPKEDCSGNWKENQLKIISENGECIDKCINDDNYTYEYEGICYNKCPKGTHQINSSEFICEKDPIICPENIFFFSIEDNSCVQKCLSKYFFTNKCFINYYSMESINEIINIIESDIINHSMNDLLLNVIDNGKNDLLMNNDNIIYQITTLYNQNNKEYKNMSTINLGECENILKTIYNIKKEETLIIFKIEFYIKGLLIPIIAYDVFHPNTKKKLDLNHCKNNRINIYIPVSIDENEIYKYDPNSEYYNDICNQTKSSNGTDITLYDRKNEYNIKNMSLCEDNCEFKEYNITSKKVLCICDIKNKSPLLLEDIINKEKLLNNFINMKSISNIEVMKCYKKLFSKNGLKDNIGSYILLSIIFIYIVSSFLFSIKGYNIIITKIENIIKYLKKKEIK